MIVGVDIGLMIVGLFVGEDVGCMIELVFEYNFVFLFGSGYLSFVDLIIFEMVCFVIDVVMLKDCIC